MTATVPFWTRVESYLDEAETIETVHELLETTRETFRDDQNLGAGDAFFPGSGGDRQLGEALDDNPAWRVRFVEGDYHWTAVCSGGGRIEYIEGDLYRR